MDWLRTELNKLVNTLPKDAFHDGDVDALFDDIFRIRETEGSYDDDWCSDDDADLPENWTVISICTNFLNEWIQHSDKFKERRNSNSTTVLRAGVRDKSGEDDKGGDVEEEESNFTLPRYETIFREVFEWYGEYGEDPDRRAAILYLLVEHVLVAKCPVTFLDHTHQELNMDDFYSNPQSPPFASTTNVEMTANDGRDDASADRLFHHEFTFAGLGGSTLRVTYLPLSVAIRWRHDGPKKYGTVPDIPIAEVFGSNSASDGVKVFISHRWAAPMQPALPGDWLSMNACLWQLLQDCIDSAIVLMENKFDLNKAMREMKAIFPKLECVDHIIDVRFHLKTNQEKIMVSKMTGRLTMNILALAGEVLMDEKIPSKPYNVSQQALLGWRRKIAVKICQRIWLWYDYACLPQTPPDRTEEELMRFRQTLRVLPQLQHSLHGTLSMNTDKTYFRRAWCVSEWLFGGGKDCCMLDQDFAGKLLEEEGKNAIATAEWLRGRRMAQAFVALVDPRKRGADVLKDMEMAFTDEKHSDNAEVISWILWNAVCQNGSFWTNLSVYWDTFRKGERLLVAFGMYDDVHMWLSMVLASLKGNSVTVDLDIWNRLRLAASKLWMEGGHKQIDDGVAQVVQVAVTGDKHSTKTNHVVPAMDRALQGLRELRQCHTLANTKSHAWRETIAVYIIDETQDSFISEQTVNKLLEELGLS